MAHFPSLGMAPSESQLPGSRHMADCRVPCLRQKALRPSRWKSVLGRRMRLERLSLDCAGERFPVATRDVSRSGGFAEEWGGEAARLLPSILIPVPGNVLEEERAFRVGRARVLPSRMCHRRPTWFPARQEPRPPDSTRYFSRCPIHQLSGRRVRWRIFRRSDIVGDGAVIT